ncbi:MAG: 5-methyltetrahydrofolate--homocysteine methyltransferase, partial [Acidobacteriota bacterium]|nr:5-methyltetrahydrofolate--homocysteine methyltransferase [Acidobacteriota bacterium]
ERGITVPVVLGGAALNRRYVDEDLKPIYQGQLFYARDAFDGLHTMDLLMGAGASDAVQAKTLAAAAGAREGSETEDAEDLIGEEAKLGIRKPARPRAAVKVAGDTTHTTRSNVNPDAPVPRAPFYGSRVVEDVPLAEVFAFVNESALFKGQWQFKQGRKSAEEYRQLVAEKVRPVYEELKSRSERERLLTPRVTYGYFPCQSEGNDLVVYKDDARTERVRFTFPRQPAGKHLCLADFFASKESGRVDVVAFQLVTVGARASEYAQELFKSDNYADYLYFHGLSVESAEALAELWHKRVREELGIAGRDAKETAKLFHQGYQGSRFSFGYPACPNLEDQTKLFELLDPARIGVSLTEEFQLEPEQSTSAIIVHHEEAKYFSID